MSKKERTLEQNISSTATTIRTIYVRLKTERMKRPYKPNPRHDRAEYYRKAAAQCWKLEADPEDYMQAAFQFCAMRDGPFANALGGEGHSRWYKEYLAARGMQMPGQSTSPTAAEEDQPKEIRYPADVDLQMDIDLAISQLLHNTGSVDPLHPANLAIMRDPHNSLECTALCLLGGYDAEVLTTFGRRIYDFFQTHPNYLAAARRRKFPIDETLQWINSQVLLSQ